MKSAIRFPWIITKHFSSLYNDYPHPGIDLIPENARILPKMNEKEKSIVAAIRYAAKIPAYFSGRVVFTGWLTGAGYTVIIDSRVRKDIIRCGYSHLSRILVKTGDKMKEGNFLGNMGSTGTDDIHLHFAIVKNPNLSAENFYEETRFMNPIDFLNRAEWKMISEE